MTLRAARVHRRVAWRVGAALALPVLLQACGATPSPPSVGGPAAAGCAVRAGLAPRRIGALRLLDQAVLPAALGGVDVPLGGISGADFDPRTRSWWLISDDRAEHGPVRVYELDLPVGQAGLGRPRLRAWHALMRPDGMPFGRFGGPGEPADAEALRLDPCNGELVWASEGDPLRGFQPFVRRATRSGGHLGDVTLPPNLRAAPGTGPRTNRAIEGLAIAPGGRRGGVMWVALEAPLAQDAPLPTLTHGAPLRFTRLERVDAEAPWQVRAQFVYRAEPLPGAGQGGQRRADNGVSEVLALDAHRLLVVERAGQEVEGGGFRFRVRLFLATAEGADDVAALASLRDAGHRPMPKRLLLDLSELGLETVGNIEAAAWGPRLPDGRATLVLFADDNFAPGQQSQVLLLAVDE